MKKLKSFDSEKAILYLVATPIGNLDDITLRSIDILKSVDIIFCEDTRVSGKLLSFYDIKTKLESYHEHNKNIKEKVFLDALNQGLKIALISDAGNPVISDPGYELVKLAIESNYSVSSIPGPSAYTTALICSGIEPKPHTYYGFLDNKKTKRIKELEELKQIKHTLIFYESIHRIEDTLLDILEVLGDRYIVIARELTKKFEEFTYGNVSEILKSDLPTKGELVIIVQKDMSKKIEEVDPIKEINFLVETGIKVKEAIKIVAKTHDLNTSDLYKKYHE